MRRDARRVRASEALTSLGADAVATVGVTTAGAASATAVRPCAGLGDIGDENTTEVLDWGTFSATCDRMQKDAGVGRDL